jgi:hypothetical protein
MPSKSLKLDREKAWRYVGRFMWSFAGAEACVDAIFEIMFNLNAIAYFLLHNRLELRKKIDLIDFGSKHQGLDYGEMLKQLRHLSHIRNAIAHTSFKPVPAVEHIANGKTLYDEAGIEFSHIDQHGKIAMPNKARKSSKRTKTSDDEWADTSIITYSDFDEYDEQLRSLVGALGEIAGHCEPINDGTNIVPDISKIIAASDNVVRFSDPKKRR